MRKAFTLLELLISTSILVILGGMIIFSQNRGPQTYDLVNAAQRLETELRKTQGFALATKDFPSSPPAPPQGGWGIWIPLSNKVTPPCYIIFGDKNDNKNFNAGPTEKTTNLCDPSKNDPFDGTERYERIFLPSTVTITSINVNGAGGSTARVVYQAPLLKMFFNGSAAISGNTVVVNLTNALGSTKTVTINSVGNVIVQ